MFHNLVSSICEFIDKEIVLKIDPSTLKSGQRKNTIWLEVKGRFDCDALYSQMKLFH